jgi:tol-pal system protein YbgF
MRPFSLLLLAVLVPALVSSCRTSQQARRTQRVERSVNSIGRDVDSLLLVEDRLINVIDSLTGLVDEDRSRIRSLEQEVTLLRARIEGRMPALPPPAPRTPIGGEAVPPTAPPVTGPAEAPTEPATAPQESRYTNALHAFNQGRYASALSEFQSLAQDDPAGAYAPNYLYWQGESLFALRRYNEALQRFTDVVEKYPNSLKSDDARFKIAECYEQMNLPGSARAAYRDLIAQHPTSEYVARAQARLRKLK